MITPGTCFHIQTRRTLGESNACIPDRVRIHSVSRSTTRRLSCLRAKERARVIDEECVLNKWSDPVPTVLLRMSGRRWQDNIKMHLK